jgi:periplasmic divalent cation tolerance protein
MSEYCIVLTTVSSQQDADHIIQTMLEKKLAACMQTLDIGSHYIWKDEVCHDQEVMILFKTSWRLYEELEAELKKSHPYETPEIIAIDIENGYKGYLEWIDETTKPEIL